MLVNHHIVSVHCFKFVRALAFPVFCVAWLALNAYYMIEKGFNLRLQVIFLSAAFLFAAVVYDMLVTKLIHLNQATPSDWLDRARGILQVAIITVGLVLALKFTSSSDERVLTSSFLCLCLVFELCLRSGRLQLYLDEIDRMVRSKSPGFPWFDYRLGQDTTGIKSEVLVIRDLGGDELLYALRRSQYASELFLFCDSFLACIAQVVGLRRCGSTDTKCDATVEHIVGEMEKNSRFQVWLGRNRWHAILGDKFEIVNNVFDIRVIPRTEPRETEILDLIRNLDLPGMNVSIEGRQVEPIEPDTRTDW